MAFISLSVGAPQDAVLERACGSLSSLRLSEGRLQNPRVSCPQLHVQQPQQQRSPGPSVMLITKGEGTDSALAAAERSHLIVRRADHIGAGAEGGAAVDPGAPDRSTRQQTARAAGDRLRRGEQQPATALPPRTTTAAAGRGGGGRGVRRRRPGEGRGRGGNRGTNKQKAAFLRSRDFVLRVRGMSRWNWRGVLRELEEAEEAEAKLGEVEKGVDGGSDGKVSVHAYNSCLMHLAKCARWREALAVLDRMWTAKGVTPNSFCLNAALDACAAAAEWKQCLALLERAKASSLEVNEISYNICIAACGAGKQWQKALGLLREIEAAGRAPPMVTGGGGDSGGGGGRLAPTVGTYGATIKALGMSGKWRESMEIFREVQDIHGAPGRGPGAGGGDAPDVVTYTTLVSALGQNGRTTEARRVWEEMAAAGVKPNAVTYHAMIAAYGNAAAAKATAGTAAAVAPTPPPPPPPPPPRTADWAEVLALFHQMPGAGVPHTSTSYGVAITAAGQCGHWEEAVALLEQMRRGGWEAGGGRRAGAKAGPDGPPPPATRNNYAYTAAITACGSNGQWEQALRLLRDMPQKGVQPDVQTYSAAISVLSSAFQPREAFRLMREMSEGGLAPRGSSGASACYAGVVDVYGRDPAMAAELAALARAESEDGPDFFAYSAAIAVCASATSSATTASPLRMNSSESSSTTAEEIEREGEGEGGGWRRDNVEAPRLLREMMAAGLKPDEACFTNALSACRDLRRGKEALAILREMEAAGVAPDGIVYTLVMTACGSAGNWEDAVSLVREMAGKGVPPSFISYSVAISACAKAGQHEPALELLKEMKDAGINPNTITYASAIMACSASGQCDLAVGLLRDMADRGLPPARTCYAPAINACAQGKNPKMALSLLREMPTVGLGADALCYAAALSALRDDCDGSAALLLEMRDVGLAPASSLYVKTVRACKEAGREELADMLSKEMVKVVGPARASSTLEVTGAASCRDRDGVKH